MILLTSLSDELQLVTSTAAAVEVHASWIDSNEDGTVITPGRTNTTIAGVMTTTVVPAPAASTRRNVQTLLVRNVDAALSVIATTQHTDGSIAPRLYAPMLAPGESLQFVDGDGWAAFDAQGRRKTSTSSGLPTVYPLGGSKEIGRVSATYVPVPSSQKVTIDGDAVASATAHLELRTSDAATSVTLRVRNLTTGADSGVSAASSATSNDYDDTNQEQTIAVTIAAGVNVYELQGVGSNADTDWFGNGYLEVR